MKLLNSLLFLLPFLPHIFSLKTGRTRPNSSNQISTSITAPESIEFHKSTELSCQFDLSSLEFPISPETDRIAVRWTKDAETFITYDSATQFQSIQSISSDPVSFSNFDFETKTTTISWSETALLDNGVYSCSMDVRTNGKLVSGSASAKIEVFNTPSVTFNSDFNEKIEFDI